LAEKIETKLETMATKEQMEKIYNPTIINETIIRESKKSRRVIKVQGNLENLSKKLEMPINQIKEIIVNKMEKLLKIQEFNTIQNRTRDNMEMLNDEIKDLKVFIGESLNLEKSSEKIISFLEKEDGCIEKLNDIKVSQNNFLKKIEER
jgi:hypothetical protein